jgi:ABC-2 type transport system permease protein
MAIFAVLFGFFFYSATAFFVQRSVESQMMGRGQPMDVNEWVIRPLLSNASVIALFLIPMITMRLYARRNDRARWNCC